MCESWTWSDVVNMFRLNYVLNLPFNLLFFKYIVSTVLSPIQNEWERITRILKISQKKNDMQKGILSMSLNRFSIRIKCFETFTDPNLFDSLLSVYSCTMRFEHRERRICKMYRNVSVFSAFLRQKHPNEWMNIRSMAVRYKILIWHFIYKTVE